MSASAPVDPAGTRPAHRSSAGAGGRLAAGRPGTRPRRRACDLARPDGQPGPATVGPSDRADGQLTSANLDRERVPAGSRMERLTSRPGRAPKANPTLGDAPAPRVPVEPRAAQPPATHPLEVAQPVANERTPREPVSAPTVTDSPGIGTSGGTRGSAGAVTLRTDRRGVRGGRVPALDPDGQTGQGPRPPVPLPRLHHRRGVLRHRPRAALAQRADRRHQPDLPVPTTPPGQATTRLVAHPGHRRHRHLDRPHRTDPHHHPRRRPDLHHPARRRDPRTPAREHQQAPAPCCPTGRTATSSSATSTTSPTIPTRCEAIPSWRDHHGRPHRTELQPATASLVIADEQPWAHHHRRRPREQPGARHSGLHIDDPPPF